jgi:hypothetical protein
MERGPISDIGRVELDAFLSGVFAWTGRLLVTQLRKMQKHMDMS